MIDKVTTDIGAVMAAIPDGSSLAIGGFGLAGQPVRLIDYLCEADKRNLHLICNSNGRPLPEGERPTGIGRLGHEGRLRKYSGAFNTNPAFQQAMQEGRAELEMVPQGTMSERLRAAGAGIPAFYTRTSADTILATGEFPASYDADGNTIYMAPKEVRIFNGRKYVLEHAFEVDYGFVKATKADRYGNLYFQAGSRNFNPLVAAAAKVTIVEAEEIVEIGELKPEEVHLPGACVQVVWQSDEKGASS